MRWGHLPDTWFLWATDLAMWLWTNNPLSCQQDFPSSHSDHCGRFSLSLGLANFQSKSSVIGNSSLAKLVVTADQSQEPWHIASHCSREQAKQLPTLYFLVSLLCSLIWSPLGEHLPNLLVSNLLSFSSLVFFSLTLPSKRQSFLLLSSYLSNLIWAWTYLIKKILPP